MKCKRIHCSNPVTDMKQVYCSRECSPYGYMCIPVDLRGQYGVRLEKKPKPVKEKKLMGKVGRPTNVSRTPEWLQKWREVRKGR